MQIGVYCLRLVGCVLLTGILVIVSLLMLAAELWDDEERENAVSPTDSKSNDDW